MDPLPAIARMKPNSILHVVWHDCTHYDDAAMLPEEVATEQLIEMQDVGFVVCESKLWIAIAQEMMPNPLRYRHITWIPKCNIKSKRIVSAA